MPTYRVPVVIRGFATVKYPDGKATGDYMGGLPRDAEAEVRVTPPYLGGAPLMDFTVEVSGPAQHVKRGWARG